MDNRKRFNDLLEELSGFYSDFEIVKGMIYFVEGHTKVLEGQS